MDCLIEAKEITKDFSGNLALDSVNIDFPRGEIYGLLGPNGAGKTTLVRIITQMLKADSGTLIFDGHQMTSNDVSQIGYLPEERGLYKKMRVGEQAIFLARLKGMSKSDAKQELTKLFRKFDIMPWWNKKIEELSKGMAQKIQFLVTIVHRPKLVIFDEPFSGFDPINASMLKQEMVALAKEEGSTVIFSTHNLSSAQELCDHFALINKGRVILQGTIEEARNSYSSNEYSLKFVGDDTQMLKELDNMIDIIQYKHFLGEGTMEFALKDQSYQKDVQNVISKNVLITDYQKIVPSMEDVFIRAIEKGE